MHIVADDREQSSGIIQLLKKDGLDVEVRRLKWCDYIINHAISIERKTGRDFLISIIDGRLFRQACQLKRHCPRPVFLMEGNPFKENLDFRHESIRGAILSLQVIWYIPVLFSKSMDHTCKIFKMISRQEQKNNNILKLRHGYRPKKTITQQLYLLQGFPYIGPQMARRLIKHFGTVRKVMQADKNDLIDVEGIGPKRATRICRILDYDSRLDPLTKIKI